MAEGKLAALTSLLGARALYERRVVVAACRDWRTFAAALALTAIATLYWMTPDDLIPDSVYFWGRIDDVAVIALSVVALRVAASVTARPHISERVRAAWRRAALRAASVLVGPLLYESLLETRPDAAELKAFQAGVLAEEIDLPPLLRGFGSVPRSGLMLRRLLLASYPPTGGMAAAADRLASVLVGTPLNAWVGPPVGFLHFEKAAGTSAADALATLFHPMQIDADPFRSMPPHLLCRRVPAAVEAVRKMPLVWGHYDFPYLAALGPGRVLFIVLREPRARLLSLYYYWRSVTPEVLAAEDGNHTVHLAHRLDLAAFLACEDPLLVDYLDNCYARRLTGRYVADGYAALAEDTLALALAALAKFDVVGVTEELGRGLATLGQVLGGRTLAVPRSNVTAEAAESDRRFRAIAFAAPDAAAERELARLTRLDRMIYAAARARQG